MRTVSFPEYDAVHPELRRVLECSTVEGIEAQGPQLYAGLNDTQKAGLFNLFAKMFNVGFDERRTVWTFVDRLFRVRADRVFVDVQPALRDLVKSAVSSDRFREVSGSLHTPPAGFGQTDAPMYPLGLDRGESTTVVGATLLPSSPTKVA